MERQSQIHKIQAMNDIRNNTRKSQQAYFQAFEELYEQSIKELESELNIIDSVTNLRKVQKNDLKDADLDTIYKVAEYLCQPLQKTIDKLKLKLASVKSQLDKISQEW